MIQVHKTLLTRKQLKTQLKNSTALAKVIMLRGTKVIHTHPGDPGGFGIK